VFILEECMNNEFLRHKENKCKWFNVLGVMRNKTGKGKNAMKIDAYHMRFETIQSTQNEDWYDSKYFESIHGKSERLCDMIHTLLRRFKSESIQSFMKRFTQS